MNKTIYNLLNSENYNNIYLGVKLLLNTDEKYIASHFYLKFNKYNLKIEKNFNYIIIYSTKTFKTLFLEYKKSRFIAEDTIYDRSLYLKINNMFIK